MNSSLRNGLLRAGVTKTLKQKYQALGIVQSFAFMDYVALLLRPSDARVQQIIQNLQGEMQLKYLLSCHSKSSHSYLQTEIFG